MPFIPHTAEEVDLMLTTIGVGSVEDLFDEIPDALRAGPLEKVPEGISEMEMLRIFSERAEADALGPCFLGAGSYDHHIPAAVWDLTSRGEFMTAYTPYQAEASQGTLQLIYEYQSMMAALTGLDVSNASVYDGASGLAEAILMAVRGNRKAKSRRVLVPETVHPHYREAAAAIVAAQDVELETVAMGSDGLVDAASLPVSDDGLAALVVQQPNFFGRLEDVDGLTDWAHEQGALMIAVANPMTLALLKPPGQWGTEGADIACGDGQPFGIPMASGGPSFGYICSREKLVRQMPGRIIGRTEDLNGKTGFALTLQAREQHIRRGKATSNICTNQGLLVTAGTIYMALSGPEGLARVAKACHQNTATLTSLLTELPGVEVRMEGPFFHEQALKLPVPAGVVIEELLERGILAGLDLGQFYPGMDDVILVCATEKRTEAEMVAYRDALADVLADGREGADLKEAAS
ncbi:MAG: aminomethyl-transferring glycine dehydrogenase subunit GcvPA [Gammaproteobacteria bacterium]|nr:MAG: aminomethyl-transferring glycine dehydrogenase subunit GcvPA [Gammaproteobacteria bacterium]